MPAVTIPKTTMPSLFDTQAGFVAALRRPEDPVPAALGKPGGKAANKRFDVYRNNVAVGMVEALRSTFPAVERLVGEEFFSGVVRAYLQQDPPTSPLLFRYGKTFGDFLDDFPPAASVPYLGDVARLDWARLEAYHAADRSPLAIECLGDLPAEEVGRATFALHPSLTLLHSKWPVVSLWAASTDRAASDTVDMTRAEAAAIIRPGLDVDTRLLPAGGFAFVKALVDGATLEAAAVAAAQKVPDFDLVPHLQGLFEIGAVTGIERTR